MPHPYRISQTCWPRATLVFLLSVGRFRRSVANCRRRRGVLLRLLSCLARPLFPLAARLPGWGGPALADVALTLTASPSAIAALLVAVAASVIVPAQALGAVVLAGGAVWGIVASDISTRDFHAATEEMTGAVEGGRLRRYLRQFAATAMLGLMFAGVAAGRFALHDPVRAGAVVAGVLALAALANMMGRGSRTPRLFMALFLFGLYVAVNAIKVPMIDAVGFNGVATAQSALAWLAIDCAALAGGFALNQRR